MTDVYARVAPGREIDTGEFESLTDKPVTAVTWVDGGFLKVTFDGYLGENTKRAVRRRMGSINRHEEILRNYLDYNGKIMDGWDALNPNTATLAQVATRLEVMTRQVRSQTRLLRLLDNEDYRPPSAPPLPPIESPTEGEEPEDNRIVSGLASALAAADAAVAQS